MRFEHLQEAIGKTQCLLKFMKVQIIVHEDKLEHGCHTRKQRFLKDIVLRRSYSSEDLRSYALCKAGSGSEEQDRKMKDLVAKFERLDLVQVEGAPFNIVQMAAKQKKKRKVDQQVQVNSFKRSELLAQFGRGLPKSPKASEAATSTTENEKTDAALVGKAAQEGALDAPDYLANIIQNEVGEDHLLKEIISKKESPFLDIEQMAMEIQDSQELF